MGGKGGEKRDKCTIGAKEHDVTPALSRIHPEVVGTQGGSIIHLPVALASGAGPRVKPGVTAGGWGQME